MKTSSRIRLISFGLIVYGVIRFPGALAKVISGVSVVPVVGLLHTLDAILCVIDVACGAGLLMFASWARAIAIAVAIVDIVGMVLLFGWVVLFNSNLVLPGFLGTLMVVNIRAGVLITLLLPSVKAQFQRQT